MINTINSKGTIGVPSLLTKQEPMIPQKENDDSSEIEIGDLSDSNSGDH